MISEEFNLERKWKLIYNLIDQKPNIHCTGEPIEKLEHTGLVI